VGANCIRATSLSEEEALSRERAPSEHAPGGEAVEVVPELVVEPGRPRVGQAGVVEAPENLGVHLELMALLLLLLPRLRGRRGGGR